jgi:putative ABC transport system permease protein
MKQLLADVRYALRQLRRSPGFTLTAVFTLAFGIGATVAIFSIVEGVLLRPLPFRDPERLVKVGDAIEGMDPSGNLMMTTCPGILAYARDTHTFTGLGGYKYAGYELSGMGEPARIRGTRLTASVFPVLGVSPLMGRTFSEQEDEGRQQVAVISYQTWRGRFSSDAHILGQKIQLDRTPYEIIGVMPRDFEFPLAPGQLNRSELWVPMSFTQDELHNPTRWDMDAIARLKPGVTPQQAAQDAAPVGEEIMRSVPPTMGTLKFRPVVRSLQETTVAQARPLVRMLFWAVAAVLFIACVNLAGLLLVRVIRHRREIAVRLALGASGAAVMRRALVEALVLSAAGGFFGLTLADVAVQFGVSFLPESLPRVSAITLDWKVVGLAVGLSLLTGIFCGLVPALSAATTSVNETLKESGRTGTEAAGHARLRSALVIAEIAAALVLLVAAGLLIRSFDRMRAVDLGLRADHTLTASYSLPEQHYATQAAVDAFNAALLNKLRELPGVQYVGTTTSLPATGGNNNWQGFVAEGYVAPKGEMVQAWSAGVMGDYFRASGTPILRGRDFTDADRAGAPLAVIVNRKLAERYWPGQDPIGKRIHLGVPETDLPWMSVVGEIGDVKQTAADVETQSQIYSPINQYRDQHPRNEPPPTFLTGEFGSMVLRTQLPPEHVIDSLRAVVRSIDPQLPLNHVQTMEQVVSEGQASRRFNTMLISSFAMVAVLLAVLGIYSVIAFSAAMRTHELAIRLALGARRSGVLQLVLAWGARLGLAGCAIGAAGAVVATRLLRSLLFDVNPLDPLVLVVAAAAIFLLALAAAALPARRAASIQPMQALRME